MTNITFGRLIQIIACTSMLASCSDSNYVSETQVPVNKTSAKTSADVNSLPAKTEISGTYQQVTTPPTAAPKQDQALDICLKSFNSQDLSGSVIAATRYENVSLGNNNNAVVFSDSTVTSGPALIRVTIESKTANQGILELNNPFGFYCINYTGHVMNNFTIKAACKAKFMILDAQYNKANNFITEQTCP
ncbi:MAG: hypothetical protein RI953_2273 [Pseudomonadota bacterium]|jgi:hypothetical protein